MQISSSIFIWRGRFDTKKICIIKYSLKFNVWLYISDCYSRYIRTHLQYSIFSNEKKYSRFYLYLIALSALDSVFACKTDLIFSLHSYIIVIVRDAKMCNCTRRLLLPSIPSLRSTCNFLMCLFTASLKNKNAIKYQTWLMPAVETCSSNNSTANVRESRKWDS